MKCPPSLRCVAAMWECDTVGGCHAPQAGGPSGCWPTVLCVVARVPPLLPYLRHAPPQPAATGGALRHGSTADRQRGQAARPVRSHRVSPSHPGRSRARARPFWASAWPTLAARENEQNFNDGFRPLLLFGLVGRGWGSLYHLPFARKRGRRRGAPQRGEGVGAMLCARRAAAHRPRPRNMSAASAATR